MRKLVAVDIVKVFFSFVLLLAIGIQSVEASISPATSFTIRDLGSNGTSDGMSIYPSSTGLRYWGYITDAPTAPDPWTDETFFEFDVRGLSIQPKMYLETTLSILTVSPSSETGNLKIAYYSGSGIPDTSRLGKGTFFNSVTEIPMTGEVYYIDVTDIYNNFITSGKSYLGFRFYDAVWTSTPSNGGQVFVDYPAILTPTPEPATLLLLGLGGVMLRKK